MNCNNFMALAAAIGATPFVAHHRDDLLLAAATSKAASLFKKLERLVKIETGFAAAARYELTPGFNRPPFSATTAKDALIKNFLVICAGLANWFKSAIESLGLPEAGYRSSSAGSFILDAISRRPYLAASLLRQRCR